MSPWIRDAEQLIDGQPEEQRPRLREIHQLALSAARQVAQGAWEQHALGVLMTWMLNDHLHQEQTPGDTLFAP